MKILPVSNSTNSTSFAAKRNDYITKKMLEPRVIQAVKECQEAAKGVYSKEAAAGSLVGLSAVYLNDALKFLGITSCDTDDGAINLCSGYNNGYYKIKTSTLFSKDQAKEFVLSTLSRDYSAFGGLMNYMEMVKDLKRQDIIQKGLKIHTYEINSNVYNSNAELAAEKLSKFLKRKIKTKDLFFVEDDAYYYDSLTKTCYAVNMATKNSTLDKEAILTCKFILNDKRNTIGYDVKYWDAYKWGSNEAHYQEQQKPSIKLKPVAEPENNQEYAEAFRFGNSEKNFRIKNGIPNVFEHLTRRLGIQNPTEDMLQIVKFYDKDKNIKARICYFDSTIGNSLVYNEDGKYMYQMGYNKDHEGNIISCNRM